MDLSKLSDDDLIALKNGDLRKVSDAGLMALRGDDKAIKYPTVAPESSLGQKIQSSIPGRILQGMRDPIDELAAMAPKGLQAVTSLGGNYENPVSRYFGEEAKRVQDINKQNELDYQKSREATGESGMDVARFVGNVASPVNAAIAARIPTVAASGLKAAGIAAGTGALAGGVGGALSPVDTQSNDYWRTKMAEALKGSAIGGVAGPIIGNVFPRIVSPNTSENVKMLIASGVTPTPGQIIGGTAQSIENRLQSVPILGDMITAGQRGAVKQFNKATLNRALEPIGESVDTIGREGVAQVRQKLSAAYDDLLPKMSFIPDQQFATEFSNLKQMAGGLGQKEASKFQSILDDVMSKASPNGSMTGETFKIVESKLGTEAKKFSGSTDAYQKELGDALNEALRIFRDTLPRSNPQYADQLSNINQGWANYARIRQAASSTNAGANEGVFTPAQLAMAVRAQDKTVGKGASAEGRALMQDLAEAGTNVLGFKYPDSGTVGRALLGGGTLASGAINPLIPAGLATAGLPFVGPGKTAMAALLARRPDYAQRIAQQLRLGGPGFTAGIPFALNNSEQ